MGNANQRTGWRKDNLNQNAFLGPPLYFHPTHSPSIRLSIDRRLAKRFSGVKGICFGDRPVQVGELITFRVTETLTSRNGALRFGLTCEDPASIEPSDLLQYASPDLTCEQGYWAKAIPEKIVQRGNILGFWLSPEGDVLYGCNGNHHGVFFHGVQLSTPLWVMLDVFGSTISVAIAGDELPVLNSMEIPALTLPGPKATSPCLSKASSSVLKPSRSQSLQPRTSTYRSSREGARGSVVSSQTATRGSPFDIQQCTRETHSAGSTPANAPNPRILKTVQNGHLDKFHNDITMQHHEVMPFHYAIGRNICLSSDRRTATRLSEDYCNGYVFTSRPLRPGEKLIVEVTGVDLDYVGGLAFGMTACDPAEVRVSELPDDSDQLLDRPEYWVVHKDVCIKPEVGDKLTFYLTRQGEVRFDRNRRPVATLMHVDILLELWAFIDVYGTTQRIKSCGVTSKIPASSKGGQKIAAGDRGCQFARSLGRLNPISPPDRCQTRSTVAVNEAAASRFNKDSLPARNSKMPLILMMSSVDREILSGPQQANPLQVSHPFFDIPVKLPPPLIPVPASALKSLPLLSAASKKPHVSTQAASSSNPDLSGFKNQTARAPKDQALPPADADFPWDSIFNSGPAVKHQKQLRCTEEFISTLKSAMNLEDKPDCHGVSQSKSEPTRSLMNDLEQAENSTNECVVCWDKPPDSALYTCGHMCMCFGCALSILERQEALCPICRQPVLDVIKIFRT